ncbi:pantoate--beta-alanine ligase [Gallaecimonas sp. GXIMD4217]|uniref:pantoate--beta-alanine ligase n=1 Tax=Gallaecimonas sp. GXIMD4217 TaxID=3131927 RepID=UPI00311B1D0B
MRTVNTVEALRGQIKSWRQAGESIAFVPTMGNLHDGHLTLVKTARSRADRVVVSIFVNPMQFGANEDLGSYPHTPEADASALVEAGVDLLFLPSAEVLYPNGLDAHTKVEVPGLSALYCGDSRPGHFRGVTTVVCKLFNLVSPDLAVFGMKDYQQLAIIRRMVADLAMDLDIVGVDTVREKDGLAMSSRNGYLSPEERARAPALHACLQALAAKLRGGYDNFDALIAAGKKQLGKAGLVPDYLHIVHADSLEKAAKGDEKLVILAAAQLGRARLIDNLVVDLQPGAN